MLFQVLTAPPTSQVYLAPYNDVDWPGAMPRLRDAVPREVVEMPSQDFFRGPG